MKCLIVGGLMMSVWCFIINLQAPPTAVMFVTRDDKQTDAVCTSHGCLVQPYVPLGRVTGVEGLLFQLSGQNICVPRVLLCILQPAPAVMPA